MHLKCTLAKPVFELKIPRGGGEGIYVICNTGVHGKGSTSKFMIC